MNNGMLVIISGPSGSGKGSVVKSIFPAEGYALSISLTTRDKRRNEVDGVDYFFCTKDEFKHKLDSGELLESASFCGNYYGTPLSYVQEQIEKDNTVILEIDVNGALQVKENFPDCVLIFMMPPTMKELRERLEKRKTEDPEVIENRLKRAEEEIDLIDQYDYLVINDDIEKAADKIRCIVSAEKLKPCRNSLVVDKFKEEV